MLPGLAEEISCFTVKFYSSFIKLDNRCTVFRGTPVFRMNSKQNFEIYTLLSVSRLIQVVQSAWHNVFAAKYAAA